jgi:hypothetical protein
MSAVDWQRADKRTWTASPAPGVTLVAGRSGSSWRGDVIYNWQTAAERTERGPEVRTRGQAQRWCETATALP